MNKLETIQDKIFAQLAGNIYPEEVIEKFKATVRVRYDSNIAKEVIDAVINDINPQTAPLKTIKKEIENLYRTLTNSLLAEENSTLIRRYIEQINTLRAQENLYDKTQFLKNMEAEIAQYLKVKKEDKPKLLIKLLSFLRVIFPFSQKVEIPTAKEKVELYHDESLGEYASYLRLARIWFLNPHLIIDQDLILKIIESHE